MCFGSSDLIYVGYSADNKFGYTVDVAGMEWDGDWGREEEGGGASVGAGYFYVGYYESKSLLVQGH